MSAQGRHVETFVKVNAKVDVGIAPVIAALSEFEGLETVESCEGYSDGPSAFVMFRYGDWRQCGALLFERLLAAMDPNLRADVSLSVIGLGTCGCLRHVAVRSE